MLNNEIMTQKPKQGYKFIYRYYDDDGSYIGQTKQSLKKRAGSMTGTNYTNKDSKFARAIIEKGFNHFNVEILCECLEEEADKKEEEYINQFMKNINWEIVERRMSLLNNLWSFLP